MMHKHVPIAGSTEDKVDKARQKKEYQEKLLKKKVTKKTTKKKVTKKTSKKDDKQRQTQAEIEAKNIVENASMEERAKIRNLLKECQYERVKCLMDLLRNGHGTSRIQAEARLSVISAELEEEKEDYIEIDWDIVATSEVKGDMS